MSIKDALERNAQDYPTILVGSYKRYERYKINEALALKMGQEILDEAKVPQLLQELADLKREEFPDMVVTISELFANYTVQINLRWNFRDEGLKEGGRKEPVCDYVSVEAEYLSGCLVVEGQWEELLTLDQWKYCQLVLEDAIVRAFRNPGQWILRMTFTG